MGNRIVSGGSALFLLIMLLSGGHAEARSLLDAVRIFPVGESGGSSYVAEADFNTDGIVDVATFTGDVGVLTIFISAGDGTFSQTISNDCSWFCLAMAVGDFNGDGFPDVAITDDSGYHEGWVTVHLGNGDGTLEALEPFQSLEGPIAMEAGDLDGDGDLDLVVLGRNVHLAAVQLNDGTGVFGAPVSLLVGEQPWALDLGDFDGDGALDLAVLHEQSEDLRLYTGNGDGSFSGGQIISFADDMMFDIEAGDLNGDGHLDLAISSWNGEPDLRILLGDGNGGFTLFQQYDIYDDARFLSLCRMNDDQIVDIAVSVGGSVVVMLGHGDGTFREEIESHVLGVNVKRFVSGDLDRDGFDDLAFAGGSGLNVAINRGDGSMRTAWATTVNDSLHWTGASDIDQDGDLDVVMTHSGNGREITALLNAGDGTFTMIESLALDGEGLGAAIGDLNGDGIPDMALAMNRAGSVRSVDTLIGQGDGTFLLTETSGQDAYVRRILLRHLNGDAHLDMATIDEDGVWIRLGNGDGSFGGAVNVATGNSPTSVDGADLDGNGTIDLVVSNFWEDNFFVLFGDGSGGFSAPVVYSVDDRVTTLRLGDLDLDGSPDLVYLREFSYDLLYARLNDGSGAFPTEIGTPGQVNVGPFQLADMSGDGLLDVMAVGTASISIHLGLGNGQFGEEFWYASSGEVLRSPISGDFDGDGDEDLALAVGWFFDNQLIFYENTASSRNYFAAGPGRGEDNPSRVRMFAVADPVQRVAEWQAYGVDRWGVNVCLGELDGSAKAEVLTGAGPGAVFGPHVRGFEDTGVPLPGVSFLAYGTNKYGVHISCGDIDGDGYDEIVTGAGPGAVFGPHVRGWNWDGAGTPAQIPGISYFAYGTPKWGVNVCCGDIDGDGYDEIITGAGPGAVYGPHVRGWNCDGGGAQSIPGVSFLAYGTNKYGVNVCCGDIDGDGIDEIVTGAGPGAVFGPHVRGWNWDGTGTAQAIPGISFFAFNYTQWGANVSCGDLDGDGIDEILTGPGPGPAHVPLVRGWNYDGVVLTAIDLIDFYGFDPGEVTHGVKPAGLRASRR